MPMLYIYLYLCVCVCLFPMVFQIFLNLGNQQLLVLESCLCETPRVLRCTVKHCPQRRLTVHLWSFDELFSAPSSTFSESGVPRRTVAHAVFGEASPESACRRRGAVSLDKPASMDGVLLDYWIVGKYGKHPWSMKLPDHWQHVLASFSRRVRVSSLAQFHRPSRLKKAS